MLEVRPITRRRYRWGRVSGPVQAWLRNRWNWRAKRRMRVDVVRWRKQSVPLDQVDISSADDDTRRVATLFEQLPGSTVLDLGYGMGESLIVAVGAAPDRVGPLVADLAQFSDAEILGRSQSPRASDAMQARQALAVVVFDVVKDRPKSGGGM